MSQEQIEANRRLYGISRWSDGYFDIGTQGRLVVRPFRNGAQVDLVELVRRARLAGLAPPILFRFTDILRDRLDRLHNAFRNAMSARGYEARYRVVYPIKVNQQRSVVDTLVGHGGARVGLETGSKPELMAVLGVSPPGGMIVCNGYKDHEYLELAMIAQRLGHEVYIVVEKLSELDRIIQLAQEFELEPRLGVRLRLSSVGAGNWQDTGGEKSKFGLTAGQLLDAAERANRAGMGHCIRMLHVHVGSQVPNLRDIRRGLTEAARVYVDLRRAGLDLGLMDVGGGLGVDYEGTRSRSANSVNYSIEDYARTVVDTIAEVCDAADMERPEIVSESGRAMAAQHAVLVTNVIDTDVPTNTRPVEPPEDSGAEVQGLWDQFQRLEDSSPEEVYRETQHLMAELHQRYIGGEIDLHERARGEALARALMHAVRDRLLGQSNPPRAVLDELKQITADKLFINMSVFQSLPDIWAIDQVFPIIPAQRLDEAPTRRGVLRDLTCDSDGRVDLYVDGEGIEHSLPVHAVSADEEYLLAILMVGAYQEILGDLHNLFGDTDSVDVYLSPAGDPVLGMPRSGDTAEQLLGYVHFAADELRASYARKIAAAGLDEEDQSYFLRALSDGLSGYTYLED
ncbi:biosynthetic arginine decarboxylase [Thioalkalivibrio sp. XN279]|uniref:biosynthetic arginine decarboxylase n=1 Tax=Thioalkalivibrio sp. XN279 TaxID=2714953 RepID=UPI00140D7289|nr:biosynthetic arginine decarboxylase [Thioalkalivibrio sp. XN279]NHA13773.1 biosynthetic arginine decarboxylase [Thioalkalivibrio sp. XN279]